MVDADPRAHIADADTRIDRPFLDLTVSMRNDSRCFARIAVVRARPFVPRVREAISRRGAESP
jgi:hypothetical protein